MRRILIDSSKIDPRGCSYGFPWDHDSVCYNFNSPEEFVLDKDINQLDDKEDIETLVIGCNLDDYSFISDMKNLHQLYIYSGEKVINLCFLENLVNLQQLYIANSHIQTLEKLVMLIRKQKEMFDEMEPKERIVFGLEAVCIETDCNNIDGTALLEPELYISEIKINHKWIMR